jgi:PST family polysaccharide transporter
LVDPNLGRSATRGASLMIATQFAKLFVQMVGIVVMARLLSPEDYGLLAMVIAIVGVGELIRDFGLSPAAIQARTLSDQQQSNLMWINSLIGVSLSVAAFFSSHAIADFYSNDRLVGICQAVAVTFLLNGISTQFRARMNRGLQFGRLAIVDLTSLVLGLSAGVVSALVGLGYWALVIQLISSAFLSMMGSMLAANWLPGVPRTGAGMSPLLRYGGNLMATQMVGYASKNIDSVLVGYRFGASSLGIYDRAFQLLMLPLNQIQAPSTNVALPVLARLQDNPNEFDRYLLRGQLLLLQVIISAFTVLWINAYWLVDVVFGGEWVDVVPILRALVIGGAFQAASYATYWVFLAKGLTGSNLRFTIVSRFVVIALVVAGSFGSPLSIAAAYSLGLFLIWPLGLFWVGRVAQVPWVAMLQVGLRTIAMYSVAGMVSVLVIDYWLSLGNGIVSFALRTGLMVLVVGCFIMLFKSFRRDFWELYVTASAMVRFRKSSRD